MKLTVLVSLASLCLSASAAVARLVQNPLEAPGTHDVWFADISFDSNTATVCPALGPPALNPMTARIYYPELGGVPDTGSGGYPLVAFLHGFTLDADYYVGLCAHITSHGFVVAALDLGGDQLLPDGPHTSPREEAAGGLALLEHVVETWAPAGLIDTTLPRGVVGHSMGAVAAMFLTACDPDIRALLLLQPGSDEFGDQLVLEAMSEGTAGAYPHLAAFDGSVYQVSGDEDGYAGPESGPFYFGMAAAAARNFHFEVAGMKHQGPLDPFWCRHFGGTSTTLGCPDQHRLHKRIVAATLLAELKGDPGLEDNFASILGQGIAAEPVTAFSDGKLPVLWTDVVASPGNLVSGLAAGANEHFMSFYSPLDPGPLPVLPAPLILYDSMGWGLPGLPATGWLESALPFVVFGIPSGASVYLQSATYDGMTWRFSRISEVPVP